MVDEHINTIESFILKFCTTVQQMVYTKTHILKYLFISVPNCSTTNVLSLPSKLIDVISNDVPNRNH